MIECRSKAGGSCGEFKSMLGSKGLDLVDITKHCRCHFDFCKRLCDLCTLPPHP